METVHYFQGHIFIQTQPAIFQSRGPQEICCENSWVVVSLLAVFKWVFLNYLRVLGISFIVKIGLATCSRNLTKSGLNKLVFSPFHVIRHLKEPLHGLYNSSGCHRRPLLLDVTLHLPSQVAIILLDSRSFL